MRLQFAVESSIASEARDLRVMFTPVDLDDEAVSNEEVAGAETPDSELTLDPYAAATHLPAEDRLTTRTSSRIDMVGEHPAALRHLKESLEPRERAATFTDRAIEHR